MNELRSSGARPARSVVQHHHQLLANRYRNKGTAFTLDERDEHHLHGLLPPAVETLDQQMARVRAEFDAEHGDLGRHMFLRDLQERNSVLFYRFLGDNLEELLPIVYTPTVGLACQQWSRSYRREHGLYLSWSDRHRIPELLTNAIGDHRINVVVATDGERILGLGDLGVGGMGIPIGKLALYTVVGKVDPRHTLPVFLDVGTDNEALLSDPLYLGLRQHRLRDEVYDEFIDAFVNALRHRCPNVLLQWEDFAQRNATRLLTRHRETICSFNDDIQGTAAVTTAAVVGGLRLIGTPLADLRVIIVGGGSAGIGIAHQIVATMVSAGVPAQVARQRCWIVDRDGLLHDRLEGLQPFQSEFVRRWDDIAHLVDGTGHVPLVDVVRTASPHVLIGVSGQPGLFTEEVVRAMASDVDRPIVLPLSNPTARAEATPSDIIHWTDGRALVGTGSPFPPVEYGDRRFLVTQVNNLYLFPGLGQGAIATRSSRITDGMLSAAASAIGSFAEYDGSCATPTLLPPISMVAEVTERVALAVARQSIVDGVAACSASTDESALHLALERHRWTPDYR